MKNNNGFRKNRSFFLRRSKIFLTLPLAIILTLLMVAIPATPALAAPVITLSPTSGAIGTKVTVTGTNFDSYMRDDISIFFNDVEIPNSPLIVPDTGSFSVNFNIPGDAKPGRAWITIKSQTGYTLAESSFIISETEIKLNVKAGTVGTVVAVDGKGFYANQMVTFYYYYNGISEKLGTEVATPIGECSYSFAIPNSTAGKHEITAKNAQGDSAEAELEVIPSTTLNPTSGAVGDILTVSGSGFGYRSVVTIYFKNTEVAYAKNDKYGCFEGIFKVLVMQPSTYEVKVEDEDGNIDKAEFTIVEVSLNKNTGHVGTELTVSGIGFIAGRTLTITYDTAQVATTTADDRGSFSVTFTVPKSKYGDHDVIVSDGTTTKQFTFTMESVAPPVPQPLLPETGVKVKSPISFDWKDVTDDSPPVTYTFQIATDKDFKTTSMVLERTELTESEYTVTEAEKLRPVSKKEPYYWRIKAIDGASNASVWTGAREFYIDFVFTMPTWAIYALFGIGALLVGIIGFWLGRRTTYH